MGYRELQYRQLVENSTAAMCSFTGSGDLTYVNDAYCALAGRRREQLIGQPVFDFSLPEDRVRMLAPLGRVSEPFSGEGTFLLDGRPRWFLWTIRPIAGEGGKPGEFHAVAQDITIRRNLESRIEDSNRLLRTVFGALQEALMVVSRESGVIVEANEAAERIFGVPLDQIGGATIDSVMGSCPGSGPPHEVSLHRADGQSFPAWVLVRDLTIAGSMMSVVMVRDLSESRRLEAQFLQAQKLESLGRLAGGVAHDFNNLLTIINGYCDLHLRTLPEGALREDLTEVRAAGTRAAALTRQLLAFSRSEPLEAVVVEGSRTIADCARMLQRVVGEDVEVVLQLASRDHIRVDPNRMQQIVLNLAVNARDAMPNGGRIVIASDTVELPVPPPGLTAGQYFHLMFSDTGAGMDRETAEQAFEPFFTTKAPGKGTGLGLSTVYGIVRQSGGHITLTTSEGAGARFDIYLPVEPGTAADARERVTGSAEERVRNVLVVEDQNSVRAVVTNILRNAGHRVTESSCGAEALDKLAEDASIDLLLTDWVMPGMSGPELADRVHQRWPGIQVLIMTGHTRPETTKMCWPVIRKPFGDGELRRRIAGLSADALPVLVVDPNDVHRRAVCDTLTSAGYCCRSASAAPEALDALSQRKFQAAICELELPGTEPLATIARLAHADKDLRIIGTSAGFGPGLRRMALAQGAVAALPKPVDPAQLLRALSTHGGRS